MEVRYFAGARDAAGTGAEHLDAPTLGALLTLLTARHPDLGPVLGRCSLLVDGVRTVDADAPLTDAARVDVLPPFAGG